MIPWPIYPPPLDPSDDNSSGGDDGDDDSSDDSSPEIPPAENPLVDINVDDEEMSEKKMADQIEQRRIHGQVSMEGIDCHELKLSVAELEKIYLNATGERPKPGADKRWFCARLTSTALSHPDLDIRARNMSFARAVRGRKMGKFVTWLSKFPNPFWKDDDNKQPKSTDEFVREITDSMTAAGTPMAKLLEVPSANEMKSMCDPKAANERATLTAYQEFVRNYFTPTKIQGRKGRRNTLGGLLLWHSVGSGKTCSYVAAASSSFETEGWHIVLSTPNAIQVDFLKNVFDVVCHAKYAEHWQGLSADGKAEEKALTPDQRAQRFAEMFGGGGCTWVSEQPGGKRQESVSPLQAWTHQRVANFLCGKSKTAPDVKSLGACQNKHPEFNKTLFIIDEAHQFIDTQFYDSSGQFNNEKWGNMIENIQSSRNLSQDDSVRFMLVTATPQNPHPANLFRLINMISQDPKLLPVQDDLYAQWVDDLPGSDEWKRVRAMSTSSGLTPGLREVFDFFKATRGVISYLDVSGDVTRFPHKIKDERIVVRVTDHQAEVMSACLSSSGKSTSARAKKGGGDGGTGRKDLQFSECVRQAANFANTSLTRYHFDSHDFDPQALRDEMPMLSEKMVMLLNRIDKHDNDDLHERLGNRSGRPYKHVIYTNYAKDARMIFSCLMADGDYESVIKNRNGKLKLLANYGCAFNTAMLSKNAQMWGLQQETKFRSSILSMFNSPKNAHGKLIRFLVIDESMQEAIDLMNVRHLHMFEATKTDVMQKELSEKPLDAWDDTISKQIVGRVSRFCGSKMLDWDPSIKDGQPVGWKLTVDRYYEIFAKKDRKRLENTRSPMELLMKKGAIDLAFLKQLSNQIKLKNLAILASVDRLLWERRGLNTITTNVDPKADFTNNMVAAPNLPSELVDNLWAPRAPKPAKEEWEMYEDEEEEEEQGDDDDEDEEDEEYPEKPENRLRDFFCRC